MMTAKPPVLHGRGRSGAGELVRYHLDREGFRVAEPATARKR